MNASTQHYDVIIVGAGIAGLILANRLAATDLTVAILDKNLVANKNPLRFSTLTPTTWQILANINCQYPLIQHASSVTKMHVWTTDGNFIDFNSAEIGEVALGYVIQNDLLQATLLEQLNKQKKITILAPQRVQTLQFKAEKVQISTDDLSLTTKLLVGADGAQSKVRELAGIKLVTRDYQQTSIIATVQT